MKMHYRTTFLAVKLIDIYLSNRKIEKSQFQMLGITALWIANKFEDVQLAELSSLIYMSGGSATVKGMVEFEQILMELVDFNLLIPSVIDFFSIYCY